MSENTANSASLPRAVLLPLWGAAGVVGAFILGFGIWSVGAELATTMRVQGFMSSASPSYHVQHPDGGRIRAVEVRLYDRVEQGDVLFRLDVREQELQRAALADQLVFLQAETRAIAGWLESDGATTELADPPASGFVHGDPALVERIRAQVRREFAARAAVLKVKRQALLAKADDADEQSARLAAEKEALGKVRAIVRERLSKLDRLAKRGVTTHREAEGLQERSLSLLAEIEAKEAEMIELRSEARQARLQADTLVVDETMALSERLGKNIQRLSDLRAQVARLDTQIENATVRAPVGGTITALPVDTPDMVARSGETLAAVSQPLAEPEIELQIPPQYIDQIRAEQTGKVVLNSFPARDLPDMVIVLKAVAAEAERDRDGQPIHYLAKAEIAADDLARAEQALGGRFRLSLDMPVTATLDGEPTTFLSFLTRPLQNLGDSAFEAL